MVDVVFPFLSKTNSDKGARKKVEGEDAYRNLDVVVCHAQWIS